MNRLVIIGNGFDLAHNLPTRYSDFMFSYLISSIRSALGENKMYIDKILHISTQRIGINEDKIFSSKDILELLNNLKGSNVGVSYNSHFVETLTREFKTANWVDIEQAFFHRLERQFESMRRLQNRTKIGYLEGLDKINLEFEFLKTKFSEYLSKTIQQIRHPSTRLQRFILGPINYSRMIKERSGNKTPDQIMILNFNYTSTINAYLGYGITNLESKIILNNIHGQINDDKNPIIFGIGDTSNKTYQLFEDANHNPFLKHVKLFKYLKTDNYSDLIKFINKNEFEVRIIGHSCGLSDRVMLKRIFEDHNCVSILSYYCNENDFDDRVTNISRHFSNKTEMMNKLVSWSEDDCLF